MVTHIWHSTPAVDALLAAGIERVELTHAGPVVHRITCVTCKHWTIPHPDSIRDRSRVAIAEERTGPFWNYNFECPVCGSDLQHPPTWVSAIATKLAQEHDHYLHHGHARRAPYEGGRLRPAWPTEAPTPDLELHRLAPRTIAVP